MSVRAVPPPPGRRRASVPPRRCVARPGALSTAAMSRMLDDMPWFGELSAEDRSWVGPDPPGGHPGLRRLVPPRRRRASDPATPRPPVFGAAPRALAGVITLQQTVDLVRLGIEVVETQRRRDRSTPRTPRDVHAAVLRYAREVAFATAEVYARAAEVRGAWDARLEALVVDSVLRAEADEAVLSRASALGWAAPRRRRRRARRGAAARRRDDLFDQVRRAARAARHGRALRHPGRPAGGDPGRRRRRRQGRPAGACASSAPGPVVVGPASDDLAHAHVSRPRGAVGATAPPRAGPTRPGRSRADDLLPERALAGDGHARRHLVDEVYLPLRGAARRDTLVETLTAYFAARVGRSRRPRGRCSCHPNTVRYRLRQVADLTGLTPDRPPRRVHARRSRSCWAGHGPAPCRPRICRNPTKSRPGEIRARRTGANAPGLGRVVPVLVIVAPGQGAQTPGFLAPWLEDPTFASRFEWLSTVAGLDLAHYGTEADAETIRDTQIAQPLLVATGLIAALELFPHPADAFGQIGAVAGHSVGEITAAAGARAITAEQAMVLVRERGKAMAEAAAVTPTGMTAVLGGDRDEVLAAIDQHGLTARQRQRSRPDRGRRHPGAAPGVRRRAARQGAAHPAQRRRRVPHPAHGAGRRPPGRAGPLGVDPRPAHAGDLQPRRPDRPGRP